MSDTFWGLGLASLEVFCCEVALRGHPSFGSEFTTGQEKGQIVVTGLAARSAVGVTTGEAGLIPRTRSSMLLASRRFQRRCWVADLASKPPALPTGCNARYRGSRRGRAPSGIRRRAAGRGPTTAPTGRRFRLFLPCSVSSSWPATFLISPVQYFIYYTLNLCEKEK